MPADLRRTSPVRTPHGAGRLLRRVIATPVAVVASVAAASLVVSTVIAAAPAAAVVPGSPWGLLNRVPVTMGAAQLSGFAADPDTQRAVAVAFTLDGRLARTIWAGGYNGTFGARHPWLGPHHGFRTSIRLTRGSHRICAIARNAGPGRDVQFGCATVVGVNDPVGTFSSATHTAAGVVVGGWAVDPNVTRSTSVSVAVDGRTVGTLPATRWVGLPPAWRSYGSRHGFAGTVAASTAAHTVCVTALNIGWGWNHSLGCRTVPAYVTVPSAPATVTYTDTTSSGFTLSWTAPRQDGGAPVTGYQVLGLGRTPLSLPALQGSAQASGLLPGHSYRVSVAAINRIGTGPAATVTVVTRPVAASAPTNVTVTSVGISSATIRWGAPAYNGGAAVSGYRLTVTTPGGATPISSLAVKGTSATVSGLSPATAYTVSVVAANAAGTGAAGTAAVTTRPTVPYAPAIVSATAASATSAAVNWSVPTYDGGAAISGYVVTVSNSATRKVAATATVATTATVISGLTAATGYTVSVYAKNVAGNGPAASATVTTDPTVPNAPTNVGARATSPTAATVSWKAPAYTGGAPITGFAVSANSAAPVTVAATATSYGFTGLAPQTRYTFRVSAINTAGTGTASTATATTPPAIPAQTTPAPVSTSHYLRNLTGRATDATLLRTMGAVDAGYNPSGHRYLVLQDIGAQSGNGVLLSATTRWISYGALVTALDAYVDGYASRQKVSAPMLLAIGTNNDGAVSYGAGVAWAQNVVNPVAAHAARYANITVAGADDMEPGFSATVGASRSWLSGYLSATARQFVFNGSADGCPSGSGTVCNNGWRTTDLHWLAGGAAPNRILSLPQIYNSTMPWQWKVISAAGPQKVNFAGPLTEWTACSQAGGCGSATNVSAWTMLFNALRSTAFTAQAAIPYGTDLRIN